MEKGLSYYAMGRGFCMAVLLFFLCACSSDVPSESQVEGNLLELSASKISVSTRVDPAAMTSFAAETKYSIYAFLAGNTDLSKKLWTPNPRECVESGGEIDYYQGNPANKVSLGMKSVDFYGLTYNSTTDKITEADYVLGNPMLIAIKAEADGKVKDLMYSDNLKNCNSSQGVLQMNFKHATSKIKFKIYKQDESKYDSDKQYFKNATLKKIEVKTVTKANFNVVTGEWGDRSVSKDVVFFNNSSGVPLQTSIQPVDGEDLLIIPNGPSTKLAVTVILGNVTDGNGGAAADKIVNHEISSDLEGTVMQFLPNHQYTLAIGVLREKGKIVIAFEPTVEPWKDIDIDLGES